MSHPVGADLGASEVSVYIGSYTRGGEAHGIRLFRADPGTGEIRRLGAYAAGPNPSYLAVYPSRRLLFAVNEVEDLQGEPTGAVSVFRIDSGSGDLTFLNRQPSGGGAPCYLTIDHTGRFLLVANYSGSTVAVLPVNDDGTLQPVISRVQHQGSGPDADRQDTPHPHCVLLDAANRFALVADLGMDAIVVHHFDERRGTLLPANSRAVPPRAGAGPRHLAWGADGQVVYATNELDSTVAAFRFRPGEGSLAHLQTVPATEASGEERNHPAAIRIPPPGRFVYASNRGDDSISVFAIRGETGEMEAVQRISSGGKSPRDIGIDPTGRLLLAANQKSDSVVGFHIDPVSGRLTRTGQQADVPEPVCVCFGERRAPS